MMNKLFLSVAIALVAFSCKKSEDASLHLTPTSVTYSTHELATFSSVKNTKYFVVFEAGLGDNHTVWLQKNIISKISPMADVVLYDRAGYGQSGKASDKRNIAALQNELAAIINRFANGRKAILVGHSLGGYIIRDYAVKNPDKVAALLFVDTSHEQYNGVTTTQAIEDEIVATFQKAYGSDFGATLEAKELVEDAQYMAGLSALPDVPTTVLTSIKTTSDYSKEDRQRWYDAHEKLKTGIKDFTHITTDQSGHYIMLDQPDLVTDNLSKLLSKLP
jgi:surfactin synthase thioesterase subunit